MSAGSKILAGLREAVRYVRGKCRHRWLTLSAWSGPAGGEMRFRMTRRCAKCGVTERVCD